MEAPDKIYICDFGSKLSQDWSDERCFEKDIEYVRKDAFLENACEYLQINLWRVVNEEPDFRQRFVTDFRNYMED